MNALELATALETGPDCTCHAAGYFECCCDTAVWPEQWLPHAAAELRRLHTQCEALLYALKTAEPILARMYGQQAADLPPMQIVRATIAKAREST